MVLLPKLIFPVKDDDRIELTAGVEIHGIRLLYKTDYNN